jgi:hypothetical protein
MEPSTLSFKLLHLKRFFLPSAAPGITLLHTKVNGINGDDEEIIPPTKEMLQQHMHHSAQSLTE